MTFLLIWVAINILSVVVCLNLAKSRGAQPVFWGAMGALFGPFAIPFAYKAKASDSPSA